MIKNLYAILNVQPDADDAAIRKAYHKLALQYHPDKNPTGDTEERFKDISEAYDILSDPAKRSLYDQGGYDSVQNSNSSNTSPFDIFNMFFRHDVKKTRDLIIPLTVDLAEVYTGVIKKVPVVVSSICPNCHGTGGSGAITICAKCDGKGVKLKIHKLGFGISQQVQSLCIDCRGTGETIDPKLCCNRCNGKRNIKCKKILNINILKGMKHNDRLCFPNKNKCSPSESSDIIVVLNIQEHPIFIRKDNDLFMKMNINLTEALCGFERVIQTLDKRILFVKHESEVFKPGTIKCIHNEGMPVYKSAHRKGKLLLEFNIIFPLYVNLARVKDLEDIIAPRKQFTPLNTYQQVSLDSYDQDQDHENTTTQCPVQ